MIQFNSCLVENDSIQFSIQKKIVRIQFKKIIQSEKKRQNSIQKNIQFKIILGQFNSIKYSIKVLNFKRYFICMIRIYYISLPWLMNATVSKRVPIIGTCRGKKKLRGGSQNNFPHLHRFRRFCRFLPLLLFSTVFYPFSRFFFLSFSTFLVHFTVFFGKKSIQSIIQNMIFQWFILSLSKWDLKNWLTAISTQ